MLDHGQNCAPSPLAYVTRGADSVSNHWLRLWHDMPTDPKWRTISRVSKQPISLVISVYVHLMVSASRNVTRGHADVTPEDIASALDVTEDEINCVIDAMQGRVLNGYDLSGWDSRQPKREDVGNEETGAKSAAERQRDHRARIKAAKKVTTSHETNQPVTQCHEQSQNVTTEERRGDTEKSISTPNGVDRAAKRASQLSADFCPNENGVAYAENRKINIAVELESFRNWHIAKGTTMKDWQAAWRTWCDKAVSFGRTGNQSSVKTSLSPGEQTAYAAAEWLKNEGATQ